MGYKSWLCLIFSLDKYSIIYIINNFNSIWEVSFGKVFNLINKRGGFMSFMSFINLLIKVCRKIVWLK